MVCLGLKFLSGPQKGEGKICRKLEFCSGTSLGLKIQGLFFKSVYSIWNCRLGKAIQYSVDE